MSVVKIPGGTATLRDELVSERHFRILEAGYVAAAPALQKLGGAAAQANAQVGTPEKKTDEELSLAVLEGSEQLTPEEALSLLSLQDAAIVAFLERWSLSRPLPTMANVGDLERPLYRALGEATKELAVKALGLQQPTFDPQPAVVDARTGDMFPTGSSSTSDGPLREELRSNPTETPYNAGLSIVTESSIRA